MGLNRKGSSMSKIQVQRNIGGIEGLHIIEPKVFSDTRGYLMESYNESDFIEEGLTYRFIQDNEAVSKKGVLRGFHVNQNHPQSKLIRVICGEIYDVVIDLRKESNTFKKWVGVTLSADNKKQLYIPEGFGHGYQAIEDSVVGFKVTTHWIAGDEVGFAWNSKEFNIDWPIKNPIQSEKDRSSLDFSKIKI